MTPSLLLGRLGAWARRLWREVARFGLAGFVALSVDLGVFNVVVVLTERPLVAKLVAGVFATTVAFFLHRSWSFRHRSRSRPSGEYALFVLLNVVGILIALSCLAFSRFVLGLDSLLADNVAANGFGLVLGTVFRFWSYRRFLWRDPPPALV